ncbi:MAG: 2'-5' RNA ligase family protein [Actinomycetota bacterium]
MPGVDDARRHLLFLLEGEVADVVQALRARWDPVMAARIPPHVSLVYPEEVTDERLLLERATTHTATTDAFSASLTELDADDDSHTAPICNCSNSSVIDDLRQPQPRAVAH